MPATMTKPQKTQTLPKPQGAIAPQTQDEGWEDAPNSSLPPFCIPEVGDTIRGILVSRDVRVEKETQKVKGKKVEVEKERITYRFRLTAPSQGLNGGKKTGVRTEYQADDVVSVPGAGSLDRSMDLSALKLAGKPLDGDEAVASDEDYQALIGREFIIERKPDSTMKGGNFKGNPVKVYDVKHRKLEG